jgi:hypothetical protein
MTREDVIDSIALIAVILLVLFGLTAVPPSWYVR